jgi:hypothetical protein
MSFGTDAWDTTFSTGNFSPNSIGGNIYRFSDRYSAGAGHATTDFAIQLCYSSTTAHDDLGLLSKINNNLSFKVERNDDNELFRICRFNVDGRTATGSDMRIDISAPECSSDENAFPVINYYQN